MRGAGLTFAVTGSRARITRTGWLVGEAAGVDSLRVTYGGRTAAARVEIVRPALGAPLPVQLTRFTAVRQGADAHLRWTTALEQASAYFVVESSVDGRVFRPLHQLPARGTTTQRTEYSFTDAQIGRYDAGQVYYRLHQVDQDGYSTYSAIQVVIGSALGPGLQVVVHPNPVHGSATLLVHAPIAGTVRVTIADAVGRTWWQHELLLPTGSATLALPALPSGLWILRVQQEGRHQALRLLSE